MLISIEFLLFIALASESFDKDEDLYSAIQQGDSRAFKIFFDKYYDPLYVYLRNRQISRDAAEDLIQKAFLYIWEHRENIKPELSLKAYLYRIAYTRMLNYLDSKPDIIEYQKHTNGSDKTPLDAAKYEDLHSAFKKAVSKLPERRRQVFESCFIQDMTYKETAELLSISVKTVENHMALAFKDLRKELEIFKKN